MFPIPKPQSPKTLITSIRILCSSLQISSALSLFSLLRLSLSSPFSPLLSHPISSLLSASTSLLSLPLGSSLHSLSLSLSLLSNPFTLSRLVSLYTALGSPHLALSLLQQSSPLHPLPWNILISSHLHSKRPKDAIFTYRIMRAKRITPDKFTFSLLFKAFGEIGMIPVGIDVGLDWDLVVWNALMGMYVKCGALEDARKVFDEMPERDVVSWNCIVMGYSGAGRWGELLELMRFEGFEIGSVGRNCVICGFVWSCNYGEALGLISCGRERSCVWDVDCVTLVLGLKACAEMRELRLGKEIHGLAIRSDCDEVGNVCNALVRLYSRCRRFGYARVVFERCSVRSVVTWNSMIAASFVETNNVHEASLFLRGMIESGIEPSQTTIVTMLAICADSSFLWLGVQLHCYAVRHGFEHYLPIGNSMVDMYCKSGRVSAARKVFDLMPEHDKISYTALIAGYASRREGVVVQELIDEMIGRGIEPDLVMLEVIRSVWGCRRIRGTDGLCDWNHSSVEGLVQYG